MICTHSCQVFVHHQKIIIVFLRTDTENIRDSIISILLLMFESLNILRKYLKIQNKYEHQTAFQYKSICLVRAAWMLNFEEAFQNAHVQFNSRIITIGRIIYTI